MLVKIVKKKVKSSFAIHVPTKKYDVHIHSCYGLSLAYLICMFVGIMRECQAES